MQFFLQKKCLCTVVINTCRQWSLSCCSHQRKLEGWSHRCILMHTTDLLDLLHKKNDCNFVRMWTEKYYNSPILQLHTKNTLARLQESKGSLRWRWSSWWRENCCFCACGKDCGIISCYQLILGVYRHFTHSIYYSHALNPIWGLDMEDRHAHKHTKAAYILLCSLTTTEDTVRFFFRYYFFHEHFKWDSLCAAGIKS